MALFTAPPELPIGSPNLPYPSIGGSATRDLAPSQQIFTDGSKVFVSEMSYKNNSGGNHKSHIVAKRGSPWTQCDAANWEATFNDAGIEFVGGTQCASGGIIHLIGATSFPGYLYYTPFNMTSEGYGTPQNPYFLGVGTSNHPAYEPLCAARSDDTVIVVFGSNATTSSVNPIRQLKFAIISGGTLGSPTTAITIGSGNLNVKSVAIDADDTAHVLYSSSATGTEGLYHVAIDSAGAISSATLVESTVTTSEFGPGVLYNGKVCFAATYPTGTGIYLFESDPTTISFTKTLVANRVVSRKGYPCPVIVNDYLYIVWDDYNSPDYPASIAKIWYSIYNGTTFTSPAVAWDAGVNTYSGWTGTDGDIDVWYPTAEFSNDTLRLGAWSEINNSYDEAELYLETGIAPPDDPLDLTCGSPPAGFVGAGYSHNFTATGGDFPNYTYAITAGSLPAGLAMDEDGVVTGIATAIGTSGFTVTVTDGLSATAEVDCSISIGAGIGITCGGPPMGSVGAAYSHTFYATGGTTPYTYNASGLPPGLSFNTTTGVLSGTPTASGLYSVRVGVIDANFLGAYVDCTIGIAVDPTPHGGGVGSTYTNLLRSP